MNTENLDVNKFWPKDPQPENFIEYDFNGKSKKMFGGPFVKAPTSDEFLTINLMAEMPLPSDIYLPIKDYSCPTDLNRMFEIFEQIKKSEKDVYVGCFGGIGRTGLFMSCFLKYLGYNNPIDIVREDYHPHAVETEEQRSFVNNFPTFSELPHIPGLLPWESPGRPVISGSVSSPAVSNPAVSNPAPESEDKGSFLKILFKPR